MPPWSPVSWVFPVSAGRRSFASTPRGRPSGPAATGWAGRLSSRWTAAGAGSMRYLPRCWRPGPPRSTGGWPPGGESSGPMTDLGELLTVLGRVQSELHTVLRGLDGGGWNLPTPAPGWTVRDQVAHLADT